MPGHASSSLRSHAALHAPESTEAVSAIATTWPSSTGPCIAWLTQSAVPARSSDCAAAAVQAARKSPAPFL